MVAQEPLKFLAQVRFLYPLPNLWKCGRVRFIATVLKTVVSKGTVSSNLTASANIGELAELGLRQRFAKPSTMSSGSLVRIQYSPPKLCVGD